MRHWRGPKFEMSTSKILENASFSHYPKTVGWKARKAAGYNGPVDGDHHRPRVVVASPLIAALQGLVAIFDTTPRS